MKLNKKDTLLQKAIRDAIASGNSLDELLHDCAVEATKEKYRTDTRTVMGSRPSLAKRGANAQEEIPYFVTEDKKPAVPRHMTLELTAKCNFRCPFCYCVWNEDPELANPELDTDGWLTVLDKCAAEGVDDILFTGGEVLLRPDLFDIIAHARERMPSATLSIFTNAYRLTGDMIQQFKRMKVDLTISLQGLATYGEMTGTSHTYRRLLSLLAYASQVNWPISVSMVITRLNIGEAVDMFIAGALSGSKSIQMGPVMAGGRAMSHQELMITRGEWERVKDAIRDLPDAGVPYFFSDEFVCECRNDLPKTLLSKWGDSKHSPCPAGKAFGVIGPNGQYRTCLHTLPSSRINGHAIISSRGSAN